MPFRDRLVTFMRLLFAMPGEILDEIIDENAQEDAELLETLQHAARQTNGQQEAETS